MTAELLTVRTHWRHVDGERLIALVRLVDAFDGLDLTVESCEVGYRVALVVCGEPWRWTLGVEDDEEAG